MNHRQQCRNGPSCFYLAKSVCLFLHVRQEIKQGCGGDQKLESSQRKTFDCLPKELKIEIFGFLVTKGERMDDAESICVVDQDYRSLATAALVCREWRELANDLILWMDMVLKIRGSSAGLGGVRSWRMIKRLWTMSRYSKVSRLVLRGVVFKRKMMKRLWRQVTARIRLGSISNLACVGQSFTSIKTEEERSELFGAMARLNHLLIDTNYQDDENTLNDEQKTALFQEMERAIQQGSCKLETLIIGSTNLSSLPLSTLAVVPPNLINLNIAMAILTKEQLDVLIPALISSSSLKHLNIENSDLKFVDPKLLAKLVHKTKQIFLDIAREDQLEMVLRGCGSVGSKLEELTIYSSQGAVFRLEDGLLDRARASTVKVFIGRL